MRDKRGYIPCKTHFPKRYVTAVSGGKKSAFIFKRSAVGAFGFGGVHFVAADFDMVKAAAVAILAVYAQLLTLHPMCLFTSIIKNLLIVLILFFTKQKVLFRKNVLIIKTVT